MYERGVLKAATVECAGSARPRPDCALLEQADTELARFALNVLHGDGATDRAAPGMRRDELHVLQDWIALNCRIVGARVHVPPRWVNANQARSRFTSVAVAAGGAVATAAHGGGVAGAAAPPRR